MPSLSRGVMKLARTFKGAGVRDGSTHAACRPSHRTRLRSRHLLTQSPPVGLMLGGRSFMEGQAPCLSRPAHAFKGHDELVERLREKGATLEEFVDLRDQDINELWSRSDRFLSSLLDLLDRGKTTEARARIRWSLSREPGETSQ